VFIIDGRGKRNHRQRVQGMVVDSHCPGLYARRGNARFECVRAKGTKYDREERQKTGHSDKGETH
jgi:hypothetical protein